MVETCSVKSLHACNFLSSLSIFIYLYECDWLSRNETINRELSSVYQKWDKYVILQLLLEFMKIILFMNLFFVAKNS